MARVVSESRLHARRRKVRSIRIAVWCALVLLFFIGLVALSRAAFLRVNSVIVSGAQGEVAPMIESSVRQQISGAYGHLFAKNNILLYPKVAITKNLLVQFPELQGVVVHAENFHTIDVAVVERQPVALWCGTSAAPISSLAFASTSTPAPASSVFAGAHCFLLDQNGLVYATAGGDDAANYKKYFGFAAGNALPQQYLTPDQFRSLFAFVIALEGKVANDSVASVSVDAEGDAHVFFASGFELRFALSGNSGEVLQRFMLVQTSGVFKIHKLPDFAYLDLRFGDKIYYKLKTK